MTPNALFNTEEPLAKGFVLKWKRQWTFFEIHVIQSYKELVASHPWVPIAANLAVSLES